MILPIPAGPMAEAQRLGSITAAIGLQSVMNPDVGLDINCVILFERHMNRG
jgi:hypothetical protein